MVGWLVGKAQRDVETDLDMISFGCCKASRTGIAAATLLLSIEVHGGKLVWNGGPVQVKWGAIYKLCK